ncbi:MAG: hypothetical protein ABIY63_17655 [Fibrobacteria bacterium]
MDSSSSGAVFVGGGTLDLSGRGADIFGAKNQFVMVSRSDIKGDFDVSVKLLSQTNTHEWAQAGILVANNAENLPSGGYFVLDVSPLNGQTAFYDSTAPIGQLEKSKSVKPTAYPVWLRVKKASRKFSAWYKNAEADAWKAIIENISPLSTMDDSQIALFSLSHNLSMDAHAVFDDFACLNGTTGVAPLKQEALKHESEGEAIPGPYAEPGKAVDALGRDGDATGKALRIRWHAR